jgi:putative transposase
MLDGMFVSKKRVTARKEPVLAVVGITDDGRKHVLDIMPAASESYEAWSTVLQRLKSRNLNVSNLRMVISDGCAGIIKALEAELPTVTRQRCTVYKIRYVLNAVAPAIKAETGKRRHPHLERS